MGNAQNRNRKAKKAFVELLTSVREYLQADKNTSDYINNYRNKNNDHNLDDYSIIPSGLQRKLKSKELCESGVELVNRLFSQKIIKEVNSNILIPSTVHKIGDIAGITSQIGFVENLLSGDNDMKEIYSKWVPHSDELNSEHREKLGHLSSIRRHSESDISYIIQPADKVVEHYINDERLDTRKDTNNKTRATRLSKPKGYHFRQKTGVSTKSPRIQTIMSHMTKSGGFNNNLHNAVNNYLQENQNNTRVIFIINIETQ
jgi:hypothetical protein